MADTGKFGKKMGDMHPRTQRRLPADPDRVTPKKGIAPHKLPRVYELLVVTTTTTVEKQLHRYASKKEREEARALMEKRERLAPGWRWWRTDSEDYKRESRTEYHENVYVKEKP
jgi:hypothetical protein